MSYDLKEFYRNNLPYYHNIGQIANEIRKQHMPNYKTRHFVEDYHRNTVDTFHDIDNLEEKLRKIIFNMYDVNRYNRISIPLYSEKKRKFALEDAEQVEEDEKESSFMAKIASRLGSSKTSGDEIAVDYKLLKEALLNTFIILFLKNQKMDLLLKPLKFLHHILHFFHIHAF